MNQLTETYREKLEMSEEDRLQEIGVLAEIYKEQGAQELNWRGKISVAARRVETLARGDMDFDRRLEAARRNIGNYYRECSKTAPARCIDGRPQEAYDPTQSYELGPQVPGGTAGTAIAYRAASKNPFAEIHLIDDIDTVTDTLAQAGRGFGGHISDHHDEGSTGCGAIDEAVTILRHTTDFKVIPEVHFFMQQLMGEEFDEQLFSDMLGSHTGVQAARHGYFQKDEATDEYKYKQRAINELADKASNSEDAIECLTGPHNEVELVINFVPNTTFDRDAFAHESDNEFQAFNYDIWNTYQVAEVLFPDDEYSQNLFVYSRVSQAITTAMVLTDGSLNLSIRR